MTILAILSAAIGIAEKLTPVVKELLDDATTPEDLKQEIIALQARLSVTAQQVAAYRPLG